MPSTERTPQTGTPQNCCSFEAPQLSEPEAASLATAFKALGDPIRLRMLSMIASAPEVCVCEITPAFQLSSGTISHHLRVLREAGLVTAERRGTFVWYRSVPEALAALGATLTPRIPREGASGNPTTGES